MQLKKWYLTETNQLTVSKPFTTRVAANKARANSPATAYYRADGSYVSVDNQTLEVIQISRIGDKNWIPDSSIVNPFKP